MKINILYKFRNGAWGGGNQFLKALRGQFIREKYFSDKLKEADVVLFNSYPFGDENSFNKLFRAKIKDPQKIIIHRLDGPISSIRNSDQETDLIIRLFIKLFADGIVFQSKWSREQNKKLFNVSAPYETVIYNAPDKTIFNSNGKSKFNPSEKIKLIAVSWSSNWKKGFEIYKYLDKNLDFSRYEMTFAGNSPIKFKNIKHIQPVSSPKLAEILKQHDIYITASRDDPCSNSLIEALSCGLPAIALNSGGHPELIQQGGKLFNHQQEIIDRIEEIASNYYFYQSKIPQFSIKKATQEYWEFAELVYNDIKNGQYQPKQIHFTGRIQFLKLKMIVLFWKTKNKLKAIKRKLWKT